MLTWGASVAAALAVWLAVGPLPGLQRLQAPPESERAGGQGQRRHMRRIWLFLMLIPLGLVIDGARGAAVGTVGAVVAVTLATIIGRHRRRAARQHQRHEVVLAAETMAGLLMAGRVPTVALRETAQETSLLEPVVTDLDTGGEVSLALRAAGAGPGREGLARLADVWAVAERVGAPQAPAWEQAAASLAAEDEVARLVTSEVAAARAGGLVMGVLPVAGILLGYLMGGDPAEFLLGTVQAGSAS